MTNREKQELGRQLREMRDSFQSILNDGANEPQWKQLRRYDEAAVKAVFVLESALITLST